MKISPVAAGNSVEVGDIFEAIQKGDTEQCARHLNRDRGAVRQTGWGGFTPLHFAALQGSRPLADLLLSHGADCNATCDAGQTAFHFASRQGNVHIMHQMLQHGADLRITDLQGKTALHYAVSGGNVLAAQYLWEREMFRFSDTDNFKLTPLHLAASMGNTDMVKYLLRNNRCAVDAADHQGATALHVAAERGAIEVSWLLLQEAGLHVLHLQDNNRLTPVDLSRRGDTFRHQQLTELFTKLINKPPNHKPKESRGMYYWALLFPTLGGGAIFLVAVALGVYGGLVCVLLFPWLAKCIFTQYHRMSSYQRSPNPVYLGTLAAGMFHSLLCFFGKIRPSISSSDLLLHTSIVQFSAVLWLFHRLLIKDPGHVRQAEADPRFSRVTDLVETNESLSRFCIYCEMFQPDGSKHCKLCGMCILEYDHHCLFLNRCVGRDNRRLFVLFLLAMAVAHTLFLLAAARYLWRRFTDVPLATEGTVAGAEIWVLALSVMNFLTGLWETWLLKEQFQTLSMGTSTYFKHPPHPQRPPRQRWASVISYLISGRLHRHQWRLSSVNI
ncbi:uncharacterized protein [Paramormyrops kingsleyae]|uniref:Palmitoyltransferase n=2 Tax=Paramormyrops kingsleyae TaxID=1676925 RepID=A0A3B3TAX2_9TELE|nr:protein S-acyltransferase 24-like isoform X1 [Paramormyrops kingsleyae]